MQLHLPTSRETLARLDAWLVAVSFAPLEQLERWMPFFRDTFLAREYERRGLALPVDVFARTRFTADPALAAYHTYGLGRNSPLRVYGPRILWRYAMEALRGRRLQQMNQDTLQRGGDFVIGRNGRLTLAHTGRDQAARPPIAAILDALARS